MRKIIEIVLLVFLFAPYGFAAEPSLEMSEIKSMLANIEQGVRKRNIKMLAPHFTNDAKFTLIMPIAMGGEMTLNKPEYLTLLEEAWSMPLELTYEVKDVDININPDKNNAIVTDLTIETLSVNGKLILTTKAKETMNVVMDQGVPKIRALYGKMLPEQRHDTSHSGI